MNERPKRTRKAVTPKEVTEDVTPQVTPQETPQEQEPRKAGRPPKEEGLHDAVEHMKRAQVILMTQARHRMIDGGRAHRVVRDLDRLVTIINKVSHAGS